MWKLTISRQYYYDKLSMQRMQLFIRFRIIFNYIRYLSLSAGFNAKVMSMSQACHFNVNFNKVLNSFAWQFINKKTLYS